MKDFKKTIINTSIVLVIVILITSALPIFYFERRYRNNTVDSETRNSLSGSIDVLFLGASHAKCAINPEIYDDAMGSNSYNLSYEMVSMKGRYEVLKYECSRNPIKTVYIELSHDALTRDQHLEGDMNLASFYSSPFKRFAWLVKAFGLSGFEEMLSTATQRSINEVYSIIHNIKSDNDRIVIKGFKSLPAYWLDADYSPTEYDLEAHNTSIRKENEEYLERIISYCKNKNIRIYLITIPISYKYIENNPSNYDFDEYCNYYRKLADAQNILYFDFNLLKEASSISSDDRNFYDACHLSDTGASAFTYMLIETINNSNNNKDLADCFYSSYTEMKKDFPYIEYIKCAESSW